jgi:cell wall-associated NlpC family hydrolase
VWGGGHAGAPGPHIGTCGGYSGAITPCPANHTVGLDCSGLVPWLYRLAGGIDIGAGSTNNQVTGGHLHAIARSKLVPGDRIYWGSSLSNTHHVAMYLGKNQYVVSADNPNDPLHPYAPARSGTGEAVFEAWFTGSTVGPHLLSWHSEVPIGYFHVT